MTNPTLTHYKGLRHYSELPGLCFLHGSGTCGAPTSRGVPGWGRVPGLPLHTSTVSCVSKNSSGSSGVSGVWALEPASELLSLSSRSTGREPDSPQKDSDGGLSGKCELGSAGTGLGASSQQGLSVRHWPAESVPSTAISLGLSRMGDGTGGWGSSEGRLVSVLLSADVEDTQWLLLWGAGWISSLLCGVRVIFSLKLKRGEVSAVVGDEGPALDTVLEGPLLSAWRHTHKHTHYLAYFAKEVPFVSRVCVCVWEMTLTMSSLCQLLIFVTIHIFLNASTKITLLWFLNQENALFCLISAVFAAFALIANIDILI